MTEQIISGIMCCFHVPNVTNLIKMVRNFNYVQRKYRQFHLDVSVDIHIFINTTVGTTDLGLVYLNKISDFQETCIFSELLKCP
jgi:hypothetical protein